MLRAASTTSFFVAAVLLVPGPRELVAAGLPLIGPSITSLDTGTSTRSGRLIVVGTGFGQPTASARLVIDGKTAITTTWSDTEIHGYVPETARLAAVPVQVVTSAGASNQVSLTVRSRVAQGRVKWRFQVDSSLPGGYVGVAPNGKVYATDERRLYALTADGGLEWVLDGAGGRRPIVFGNDGTIYTGQVVAVRPDGTFKWQFTAPGTNALVSGPGVGADGNVYAVASDALGGIGVFSLDPNGKLRWSQRPSPGLNPELNNSELQFGSPARQRFYFGVKRLRSGPYPSIYSFDYSGKQAWYRGSSCQMTGAIADPAFRLSYVGAGTCGVTLIDEDQTQIWNAKPPSSLGGSVVPQAVGPDGTVYTADYFGSDLWAVDSTGKTKFFVTNAVGMMEHLGVTPDNRLLIDGGRESFGKPGWVRGYSTKDGTLELEVLLPDEQGATQMTASMHPAFSPDSRTAYVSTWFLGSGIGHTYIYALDLCTDKAAASSYGTGWPGTNGVPGLTSLDSPVLGTTIRVRIGNSLGSPTGGLLALGPRSLAANTPFGGTILVQPDAMLALALSATGSDVPFALPDDPNLCAVSVFLQAFELDRGASHGLSFSRGLQLSLGHR